MAEMNLNPREKARLEEEKKNRKTRNKFILVGVIVVLMIALVIFVNSRLFYNVTTALTIGDTNYSVARMNYEYQKALYELQSDLRPVFRQSDRYLQEPEGTVLPV